MNKSFFFIITLLFLTGCASNFTDSYTNGNVKKLNGQNLVQASGKYKMFATREYDINGSSTTLNTNSKEYGIYKFLQSDIPNIKNSKDLERYVRNLKRDTLAKNWSDTDWVDVSFEGNMVHFELKKDNQTVKTYNVKGKFKNGFFSFPKEDNCVKIPMVFTGCIKSEKRIGITRDGQLLFQETKKYKVSGLKVSSFFKFFSDGLESVYSYEKIK